jgi:Protein of unknown function (DUF3604)
MSTQTELRQTMKTKRPLTILAALICAVGLMSASLGVRSDDTGDRKPGKDGKLSSVGSTVDVANANYTIIIGAPELIAFWKDPGFNAAERAFHYARVIEIPAPRSELGLDLSK